MDKSFLCITRKELFYAAVMLHIRQLVNVIYEFPADTTKFDQELNEAKSSLRKKKLLTESARNGIPLDFALAVCAAFCARPESCEVVNENNYCATVYRIATLYMLMEQSSEEDLTAIWFLTKENLDEYLDSKLNGTVGEGAEEDGRA